VHNGDVDVDGQDRNDVSCKIAWKHTNGLLNLCAVVLVWRQSGEEKDVGCNGNAQS